LNEADARRVLRVQAQEAQAPNALWTDADRDWATQAALQEVGGDASAERFVAARARHAMQRLAARGVRAPLRWRGVYVLLALALGVALGAAADAIGPGERIVNLLALPVWGVVAWNLCAYLLLAVHALAPRGKGALRGLVARWLAGGEHAATAGSFARLHGARAALLLHLAAAGFALGLLAGMYARALVFDYRAGWQSTFLDAGTVHTWLALLLAPASALSGVALPDAQALAAMRVAPGQAASASAAPWIHLYAVTLALVVLLPRALLAAWQAIAAARLARHMPLDLGAPYFQRLLRHQRGAAAAVEVRPHARAPEPAAVLGLERVLGAVFGAQVRLQIAPACAHGAEDEAPPAAAGRAAVIALFDLAATPEAEYQGRFVRALGTPALLLVDEAAFRARFGAASARHTERRAAWKAFAQTLQLPIVFTDLEHGDLAAAQTQIEAALRTREAAAR
jgi:hypothetical protein